METYLILHLVVAAGLAIAAGWATRGVPWNVGSRIGPILILVAAILAIAAALVYVSIGLDIGGLAWDGLGFPLASFLLVPLAALFSAIGIAWPKPSGGRARWAIAGGLTLAYALILIAVFYMGMSSIEDDLPIPSATLGSDGP